MGKSEIDDKSRSAKEKKFRGIIKLLIFNSSLIVLMYLIDISIPAGDMTVQIDYFFLKLIIINVVGVELLGFILGIIVALMPNKKLPFKRRYLISSLIIVKFLLVLIAVLIILYGVLFLTIVYIELA